MHIVNMVEGIVPFAMIVSRLSLKRATQCLHLVELYLAEETIYIYIFPITF